MVCKRDLIIFALYPYDFWTSWASSGNHIAEVCWLAFRFQVVLQGLDVANEVCEGPQLSDKCIHMICDHERSVGHTSLFNLIYSVVATMLATDFMIVSWLSLPETGMFSALPKLYLHQNPRYHSTSSAGHYLGMTVRTPVTYNPHFVSFALICCHTLAMFAVGPLVVVRTLTGWTEKTNASATFGLGRRTNLCRHCSKPSRNS